MRRESSGVLRFRLGLGFSGLVWVPQPTSTGVERTGSWQFYDWHLQCLSEHTIILEKS